MSASPRVLQVGLDHHATPFEVLEMVHARLGSEASAVPSPDECPGAVALVTCHRVELYLEGVRAPRAFELIHEWLGFGGAGPGARLPHVVLRVGGEAGRHLLRVSAGLESAVLGEDQVLGQVRAAYRDACARGMSGPLLHRLFHAAFRVGKRVRTETGLGHGVRSLAGAAIAAMGRELGGLAGAGVLLIGTGEMAQLAAARLADRGVGRLLITSRTPGRAERLAAEVGGTACPWEWRRTALGVVDGVVSATRGEEPVVPGVWLEEATRDRVRPLVVADLGAPRNVETPGSRTQGLRILDLVTLNDDLRSDAVQRVDAVRRAEEIVEAELAVWSEWVRVRREGVVGSGAPRRDELVG